MNILIVDDDADFVEDLTLRLLSLTQGSGQILAADCLCSACAILTDLKTPPIDALFLEEHLPGERSTQALSYLRSFQKLQSAKCLLMTRQFSDVLRAHALRLAVDALIEKPVSDQRLKRIIQDRNVFWEVSDLPRNMDTYWALQH